ncbi:class I SAM-dependent DNA methyltransferase [Shewanella algae]|uniref:type I restriction-modification system subunit M n=1 Tax=Shewanella algae TaxID=38313 RepID=UPI00313AD547
MAKSPSAKGTANVSKGFEESLWDSANKLRGSVESAEYKHVVLSLIFLKFISDKFEMRRAQILKEHAEMGATFADMVDFYTMENVFYLPQEARWSHVIANAKQDDLALIIDTAMKTVEKNNKSLAGALPENYFSRLNLEPSKLASLVDTINNIDLIVEQQSNECRLSEQDVVGRVYEYFLGKFAASEGQRGGEFYTPKCVVTLIAEMLEPYKGKIYDPCCGSGGMFVQSLKFIQAHQGNQRDVSIYGQEYANTTRKLAKMNLAIRGIAANLGEVAADTFFKDQHPDLKADFIMANPPFNQSQWRQEAELTTDPRWADYQVPPTGNANYGWIMHMISKLSTQGSAGFVLANGSMSTSTSGEGVIRQQIIEDDLVECMIALPGQLFYTTQIPVCLWFLTKDKSANEEKGYRKRSGETLFIDARNMGSMISRKQKELTLDDIAHIAATFHAWRGQKVKVRETAMDGGSVDNAGAIIDETLVYQDIAGYCKSASFDDIKANDFVLTPGRYVGAADIEDDGIPFETKMQELTAKLAEQFSESATLEAKIKANLKGLGYEF